MKGIYFIKNKINGKIYIGKSIRIKQRLIQHKHLLCKKEMSKRHCNRYLYSSVQKYGWDNFETGILEEIQDDSLLVERELYWMMKLRSTEQKFGYNLRMDSSTKCIVHEETKKLQSKNTKGIKNPNYNNKWTDEQKLHMSQIAKARHNSGEIYNNEWKQKISIASSNLWKDIDKKKNMAAKVSKSQEKYNFLQYDKSMNFIKKWSSVKDILKENSDWKWQNIYSVCNGYKPSYQGYIWRKELKI